MGMQESNNHSVADIIKQNHGGDTKQLEIITSKADRIVVEAPAGCGKTTTMVSKIAYMLANQTVSQNKKMLALTFSVNAAYKMKKDISEKLPLMGIPKIQSPDDLNDLMYISNYHGLCRRILTLYGYLFDEKLRDINNFKALNETDFNAEAVFREYDIDVTDSDKEFFKLFHEAILGCDETEVNRLENCYCNILKNKFFTKNCITYNGYLILARRILEENAELLKFYRKLYQVIIIDEFQDTNFLSWSLICRLVGNETRCFFMGDSLQRIYGFIGAIPNLLNLAVGQFDMDKIEMSKNYRFKDNPQMLQLDKNIRENAKNYIHPSISRDAVIDLHYEKTHKQESTWVVNEIANLLRNNPDETVAVLVQQRGTGINAIIEELDSNQIDFFYALFSDEDDEYIQFHRDASFLFYQTLEDSRLERVNKTLLNKVYRKLNLLYSGKGRLADSLMQLVEVFFERVCTEYRFLENQDKIAFITDTFENRALKQNMDLIKTNLFISTVHGAKGLEWDYVFIPDLEPYCFPNYLSLCGECSDKRAGCGSTAICKINPQRIREKSFIEELSVFYVAVTRARKRLFFSASGDRTNANGCILHSKISCLAFLPGIKIKEI